MVLSKDGQPRDMHIDVMKGLLILLVVLGHSQAPGHRFIYLFHMAVFFMISGYLWKKQYAEDFFAFKFMVKKRLKSLYAPYILCNIFFLFLSLAAPVLYPETSRTEFSGIFVIKGIVKIFCLRGRTTLSDPTWFLAVLFWVTTTYTAWGGVFSKKRSTGRTSLYDIFLIVFSLVAGGFMSRNGWNPWQTGTFFSAIAMFGVGNIMRKAEGSAKRKKRIAEVVLETSFSFIVLLFLLSISDVEISMIENVFPNPLYFLVASLAGWFFIADLSRLLMLCKRLKELFCTLGKYSLYIMCLHMGAFKIVTWIECIVYGWDMQNLSAYPTLYSASGWWCLYTVVGVIFPVLCGFFMGHIKRKKKCVR